MIQSVHLLGIAGSLRQASYNRAALRAARSLLPPDTVLDVFELGGLPLFNSDFERDPAPSVGELRRRIREADAIFVSTPEHNFGVPGVLKNAIDWASRPHGESAWSGKPVAVMGVSTSGLGTARALLQLRTAFVSLDMLPVHTPEVMIANAPQRFDSNGNLVDEASRKLIRLLLANLVGWTRRTAQEVAKAA